MSPDKQSLLYDRYPNLFSQNTLYKTESCLYCGCECSDGWFQILDTLCARLTLLERATGIAVEFGQIKQKLGTLRAYNHIVRFPEGLTDNEKTHWVEIVWAIVRDAELHSRDTCEETGDYGEMCVRGGWYKTLSRAKAKELGFLTMEEYRSQQKEIVL